MDILSTVVKTAAQYCAEVPRCQKGSEEKLIFSGNGDSVEKIDKLLASWRLARGFAFRLGFSVFEFQIILKKTFARRLKKPNHVCLDLENSFCSLSIKDPNLICKNLTLF